MRRFAIHGHIPICLLLIFVLLVLPGCEEAGTIQSHGEGETDEKTTVAPKPMPPSSPEQLSGTSVPDEIKVPGVGESFAGNILVPLVYKPVEPAGPLSVVFYADSGEKFTVIESSGEWVSMDSSMGKVWSPIWYGSETATEIAPIMASRITLTEGVTFSLYPGSELRLSQGDLARVYETDIIVSVWKWQHWLGVAMPLKMWHDGQYVLRPLLLWVEESSVASAVPLDRGLLTLESGVSLNAARQIIETALFKGMREDELRQLLGKPHFAESSRPLSAVDEPLRVGTDWRYEFSEAHFTVTLDEHNRVAAWRWRLPYERMDRSIQYPYYIEYEFFPLTIVASNEPNWEWRHRGELAYSYLLGATDDVLLLRGDDGGFSGMHQNSNVFAVDRSNGNKLWQIDAGFGWAEALLAPESEEVTVLTHFDPASKRYEERIRRLRINDGDVVWEHVMPEAHGTLTTVKGVVVHAVQPDRGLPSGKLSVFDAKSGNLRWEREIAQAYEVLNRGDWDPYILIKYPESIEAVLPVSGTIKWRIKRKAPLSEDLQPFETSFIDARVDRFKPESRNRWFKLGGERLLVDTVSGDVIARYPIKAGELVIAVDEDHWLIQRSLDDEKYWNAERFETIMYNPVTASEKWKLDGRASGGTIKGDRIYLLLEGIPTAVDMQSGSIEWQVETNGIARTDQTYAVTNALVHGDVLLWPYGTDLLVIFTNDGNVLHRIRDTQLGYPDIREADSLSGLVNADSAGFVYLGSSNGYFSKMRLRSNQ